MLLRRAAAVARPRALASTTVARRAASGNAHDEHHHHDEHADSTVYPKEDFTSGAWRYGIAFALGTAAFYQFAPARGEEAFFTRFLHHYATPSAAWEALNQKHLGLSAGQQDTTHFTQDTTKPAMHRYQYPQMFDAVSPHLAPVGMHVDVSKVEFKS